MKINIILSNAGEAYRQGYENINLLTQQDLSCIADNGEAEEVLALNVLDYLPYPNIANIVSHFVSKLAHKGKLIIQVVDTLEVCKALANRSITMGEAATLLYGEQSEPWNFRKAPFTIVDLVALFQSKGLRILRKHTEAFQSLIIGERP